MVEPAPAAAPAARRRRGAAAAKRRLDTTGWSCPRPGSGRRFGADRPKQYAPLCGRTVIEWALAPFLADSRCAGAVVALAADDPYWAAIAPAAPSSSLAGGEERSHSVSKGLAALAGRAERH